MTAGHVRGVELSSRGGWLSFALIWTWAWGAAGGVAVGRQGGGLGGEGETCLAPPQWQPCSVLPSFGLRHIPAQDSTVLVC